MIHEMHTYSIILSTQSKIKYVFTSKIQNRKENINNQDEKMQGGLCPLIISIIKELGILI